MDRRTVKSLIVELKEDNKSFQEVSDILAREYGVKMSRQAVCGMYKRATSEKAIANNMNIALATTDIVHYYVLGKNIIDIRNMLSSRGIDISISKIKEIIDDNIDYRKSAYNDLLNKISVMVEHGEDIDSIKLYLRYKGVEPSNSVIDSLMYNYAVQEIKNKAARIITDVINVTDDKSILKRINTEFNLDISIKDLSKEMNK